MGGRASCAPWRRRGGWWRGIGIGAARGGTRRRCVFNKLTEKGGLDYLAHAELVMAIPTPKTREIAVDF